MNESRALRPLAPDVHLSVRVPLCSLILRSPISLVISAILLASCGSRPDAGASEIKQPEQTTAKAPEPQKPAEAQTQVEMFHVNIRLDPELILKIRRLSGKLIPTEKGKTPSFDDKLSYIIDVDSAEIGVSTASMTHMMNAYVFGEPKAPLKDLKLSIEKGQIKQEGTIRKGPGIPFETIGDMSPTEDGKIRIHPTKTRAAHLPVKGLMKLFGVDMADLINAKHTRGIVVDDNDIILDASQALPPPKMRGKITSVRIEGDEIVQTFGTAQPAAASKTTPSNYMAYKGGVLKFGNLTMSPTDMRLVDADPKDPFDFSPDRYNDHLVAGYSKTSRDGGLIVYMPDYTKISIALSPPKVVGGGAPKSSAR